MTIDISDFVARGLRNLDDKAKSVIEERRAGVDRSGLADLEIWLASLPRRLGKDVVDVGEDIVAVGEGRLDPSTWRTCDFACADLLLRLDPQARGEGLFTLYRSGDAEERHMLLKALALLPIGPWSVELLQEAHRQNDELIFVAGFADGDVPARSLSRNDYNRAVLKAAFMDLDPARMIASETRANADLSRMLLDFMTEREAAGRPVWAGTLELAAHAPCLGVVDRVVGDLWHGVDRRRLAAARASVVLSASSEFLSEAVENRLSREPVPEIRKQLERSIGRR